MPGTAIAHSARLRVLLISVTAIVALAGGITIVPATASGGGGVVTIATLSDRADLISGGDALIRVTVPAGADAQRVVITVNGHRVTSLKRDGARGHSLTGL